jgi:hypothetical protein
MSNAILTQRTRVVADAVVSAYINEIATPTRPRPSPSAAARRPATHGARRHARAPRRRPALAHAW